MPMQEILQQGWQIKGEVCRSLQSNVWEITAGNRRYILKKSKLTPEHLRYVSGAEDLLNSRHFPNFAPLLKTGKGALYYSHKRGNFTLHSLIDGEKCAFTNRNHLRLTAEALGNFRNFNFGFTAEGQRRSVLPDYCRQLTQQVAQLKAMEQKALEQRDEFGKQYLIEFRPCFNRAVTALKELEHSPYRELYRLSDSAGHFIHGDIAARNVIITDATAILIDFDYCRRDLPLADLVRLIRRGITPESNFPLDLKTIFEGYCRKTQLSAKELEVIKCLLLFPRKFWRIAHRYYYNRETRIPAATPEKLAKAAEESALGELLRKELEQITEVLDLA